jgi:hypothetical protein
MKYIVEMGSGGMLYISSIMVIDSAIRVTLRVLA